MSFGMRKPDSLAQMAQCEGAFPKILRRPGGLPRWPACAATVNVADTDRDPGIRSEGGRRGRVELTCRSHDGLPDRDDHDETAALPALRRAACLAPVPPRDLPHQREAETSTLLRASAVERLEHALALGLGNTRTAIANQYLRVVFDAGDTYFDRRSAVALRVLQQVADHPAQQPRVAAHGDRLAVECGVV